MSKYNTKTAVSKTVNMESAPAFRLDCATELLHAVLSTFMEDKFYESGNERLQRIQTLVKKNDPEFVARLAVVARKEFHLRSMTTALLSSLSKVHRDDDLVKRAIVAATERPDDLTELVALTGTPLPKQVKRGCRNAILKFGRYSLSKYRNEGKAVSLVDVFNLTHPKVKHADKEQKKAWKDLMAGTLVSEDTWEVVLSSNRFKTKKEAWEYIINEIWLKDHDYTD